MMVVLARCCEKQHASTSIIPRAKTADASKRDNDVRPLFVEALGGAVVRLCECGFGQATECGYKKKTGVKVGARSGVENRTTLGEKVGEGTLK
jgi:hypothetical protein